MHYSGGQRKSCTVGYSVILSSVTREENMKSLIGLFETVRAFSYVREMGESELVLAVTDSKRELQNFWWKARC